MSEALIVADAPPERKLALSGAGLRAGVRQALPVGLGIFAYGCVFGMLARQTGLSLAESMLMSGLVYAGASQFAVLGLWGSPIPTLAIVVTTFVVNLRHLMMSASLYPWLAKQRRSTTSAMLFLLSDECWALTVGEIARGGRDLGFFIGCGLTLFTAWQGATVAGHLLGNVLQDPARWGLDFAFSAVFIVLLTGLWRGRRDLLPWATAGVVAVVASQLLPGNWYIVLGGLAGSLVGAVRDGR